MEHGRNQIRCATCQTSTPSFARVTVSVMDGGRAKTKRYCLQCSPVGLPDDTQLQRIEEKLDALATTVTSLLNLLVNGEVPESRSMAKRLAVQAGLPMPTFVEKVPEIIHATPWFDANVDVMKVNHRVVIEGSASSDPAPKQRRKPEPPLDGSDTWPEWFSLGHGMKGWKVELLVAEEWAYRNSFSEEYLLDKIYVVRGWWNADHEKKGRDPYRTFQRACRENWGAKAARAPASTPDQDQERHRAGYEKPRRMVGREDAPDKD